MNNSFIEKLFPAKLSYREFIFIPLFFSFYIVLQVFEPSSFLLHSFTGRPISIATYEGIDIGKRVNLFYRAIGFSAFLVIVFTRIVITMKDYFLAKELSLINGISLAGFCLLVFQLSGAEMTASIHFIFSMLIVLGAGFIFHQVKKREDNDFAVIFVWTILITVSVYFLGWQLMTFAWGKSFLSLPVTVVITGIPVYILFTDKFNLNYRVLMMSQPFLFMPLLAFVSMEFFMIMNQHGMYVSPLVTFIAGLVIISSGSFYRYRNFAGRHPHRPLREIIFKYMLPVILIGLTCLAYYTPVVSREIDWFEDANHVLPIQQWNRFGRIPFLDSFNAHALSDFGMGILYSVLNGVDPMGVFVYRFLISVFYVIIIYFFIYKITGDGFLSTWIAIAFPYTEYLLPSYFNIVPLAALSFVMIYEKQSVKRYAFFFLSVLFMILWRIDLGSSVLVAAAAGFAILIFFAPSFRVEKNNLFKGLGLASLFLVILIILGLVHSGSHIIVSLKDALAYMSSFQSYGNKDLAIVHDLKYYSLYFILPAAILMILIHTVYNLYRGALKNPHAVLICISVVFFGLFYFSNLQRGIVRHTLAEQWDAALISFAFFIISSAVLVIFFNRNHFSRFFHYFIVTTLLIANYSFTTPDLKKNNNYGLLNANVKQLSSFYFSREKIARFVEVADAGPKYLAFSEWMNRNFSRKSTFLDFSNSPMLYYYTGKIVPNYFDQIPHTAHNEYLQKRFLADLKNYDIPVVVFSNQPKGFWDGLDGIPNTMRHYRITEYIYRNYKPAYIINNRRIWVRKNFAVSANEAAFISADTIADSAESCFIKWIPYVWGTYDSNIKNIAASGEQSILSGQNILKANTESTYTFTPVLNREYGNYILLHARVISGKETDLALNYGDESGRNGSFNLNLKGDTLFHDYLIRISTQYNWYSKNNSWLSLYTASNDVDISKAEILKGD